MKTPAESEWPGAAMDGIECEGRPVCLYEYEHSGRVEIVAFNEGGYNHTCVDLAQLLAWLWDHRPELIESAGGDRETINPCEDGDWTATADGPFSAGLMTEDEAMAIIRDVADEYQSTEVA